MLGARAGENASSTAFQGGRHDQNDPQHSRLRRNRRTHRRRNHGDQRQLQRGLRNRPRHQPHRLRRGGTQCRHAGCHGGAACYRNAGAHDVRRAARYADGERRGAHRLGDRSQLPQGRGPTRGRSRPGCGQDQGYGARRRWQRGARRRGCVPALHSDRDNAAFREWICRRRSLHLSPANDDEPRDLA